jgi:predicted transposase/invertase (TIGR01784 family)
MNLMLPKIDFRAEEEEEFKMVAEKNPVIKEAYCKLQVMSEDEANRMIYEARLKAQRDEYSRIQGAHAEGLNEGREEEKREIARAMKANNMPLDQIRAYTGLSEEQIREL